MTNVLLGLQSSFDSTQLQQLLQLFNNASPNITLPDSKIFVGNSSDIATPVDMTGDITINNLGITKFRDMSALSVFGNSTNGITSPADIVASGADQVFRVNSSGTSIGWGAINIASANAVSGVLSTVNGGTNLNTIGAASTFLGVNVGGTALEYKSINGTANRISVNPSAGVSTIDISATYVGQSSVTTLGTITTGVWNGTTIGTAYGGSPWTINSTNIYYSTGKVGIQSPTTPLSPLHVGNQNVNNSSDAMILISRSVDDGTAGNGHAFSDSSNVIRSGGIAYNSFDCRITFSGTNVYNHYAGFQFAPTYSSTGAITNMYGYISVATVSTGATVGNFYHVKVSEPTNTGTINNQYGIYIDQLTTGGTNWAIYTAGTSSSRIGGNFLLGLETTGAVLTVGNQTNNGTSSTLIQQGKSSGGTALSSTWALSTGGIYSLTTQGSSNIIQVNTINGLIGINATTPVSNFDIGGSFGLAITTITNSTTLTVAHSTVLVDASGGNVTITLPGSSAVSRRIYTVKKIDATANTVTIDPNASETIDGATTVVLSTQWSGRRIHNNGSAWFTIATF